MDENLKAQIRAFPDFDKLSEYAFNVETLCYKELVEYSKVNERFEAFVLKILRLNIYTLNPPISEETKRINVLLKQRLIEENPVACKFFDSRYGIKTSKEQKLNGYMLYDMDTSEQALSFGDFMNLNDLWNKDMSEKEFREWFESEACTDWNKMQPDGSSFGGHYDDEECTNAYDLTRSDNLDALCKLPFPFSVLAETIDIGCAKRMESVRYSNAVCYWIQEKAKLMFKVNTLQQMAANALSDTEKQKLPKEVLDSL